MRTWARWAAAALLLVLLMLSSGYVLSQAGKCDAEKAHARIRPGMTKEQVLAVLGDPKATKLYEEALDEQTGKVVRRLAADGSAGPVHEWHFWFYGDQSCVGVDFGPDGSLRRSEWCPPLVHEPASWLERVRGSLEDLFGW